MDRIGKPRFTEAQYRYAREEANALEYAQRSGYSLIADGGSFRLSEHRSMVFTRDGRWFWNSRGLRGRAIEFLMHYEGRTLPDAVLTLCRCAGRDIDPGRAGSGTRRAAAVKERPPFVLPPRSTSSRRLFAYLCGTRMLDRELVSSLVSSGDLYESVRTYADADGRQREAHNAVFVGRDAQGVPRSAFQRGLTSFADAPAFKRDAAGSRADAPFCLRGRSGVRTVAVFEGAIDALSHASICKLAGLDHRACDRIALGGTQKGVGLTAYLAAHPEVVRVELALDEDDAGRTAAGELRDRLPAGKYEIAELHQDMGKDWNDCLIVWRGVLSARRVPLPEGAVGCIRYLDRDNTVAAIASFSDLRSFRETAAWCLSSGKRAVVEPAWLAEA